MRELLHLVLDRMSECYVQDRSDACEEAADIRHLRGIICQVLQKGYYDGVLLSVDMCRLPHEVVK